MITYNNTTMILKDWADFLGIKPGTLNNRLRLGWSIEKAFETPLDTTRKKKVIL